MSADADTLALYIHWPWCVSKCPYCDFNSHASAVDEPGWLSALLSEMESEAGALDLKGRAVSSIFFGGGTPGLMSAKAAGAVIERAGALFRLEADAEITLEANPSSAEAEKFRALRDAGVNRLSLGVQSFDDEALAFLGRAHDADQARRAIAAAAETFPRFSFDLIYARPGQTQDQWAKEMEAALVFAPRHLSLYQLTIEPGTRFDRDGVAASGEDEGAALYEMSGERMAGAGLMAYEVSNYAIPGEEARHNLHVWRGSDYLGLGPGAHGRVAQAGAGGNVCFQPGFWEAHRRIPDPLRWMRASLEGKPTVAAREMLDGRARAEEIIMGALRTAEGVNEKTLLAKTGVAFESAIDADALRWLVDDGFIVRESGFTRTTAKGRLTLNAVTEKLLA